MKYVALGKQESYIHKDQTEEIIMLYFTMYKNELSRYWESSNQEHITRNMDQLMELFFYGLIGEKK